MAMTEARPRCDCPAPLGRRGAGRALVLLLGWLLAGMTMAQEPMRIEALDGGIVDLGGVTRIVGRGQPIDIHADGTGSLVSLDSLDYLLNQSDDAQTLLRASAGGRVALSPGQTLIGNSATLELAPDGEVTVGTLMLDVGGTLSGAGTLTGHLVNGGRVRPTGAAGGAARIAVTGDYAQQPGGELAIELGGGVPGDGFDQLAVAGSLTLDGSLTVAPLLGFVPVAGTRFEFLSGPQPGGGFAAASGLDWPGGGSLALGYDAGGAFLSADGLGFIDGTGPVLADLSYDGAPLAADSVLRRPGLLGLTAVDPSLVDRVELSLDDAASPFAILVSDSDAYATDWDIAASPDGAHTLHVTGYDTYGNASGITRPVEIALAPPPPPQLTAPADGFATSQALLRVSGTTADDAESVQLYLDGAASGTPLPARDSRFSGTLTLADGNHQVQAAALNRGGEGDKSLAVTVTLDQSIPDAPAGLYAESRPAGTVRLTWTAARDASVVGYALYRAGAPFGDGSAAVRIDGGTLAEPLFDDLPDSDGTWYYRVAAISRTGTASALSNQASAVADRVPPRALAIDYLPQGPYDAASGRIGVGRVDLEVELSEPALTAPFLTIAAAGGVARPVPLTWADDTHYVGHFQVTDAFPSGTAQAVFSARDAAGNRGTDIDTGATVPLDTDGPAGVNLLLDPADPVRNGPDAPVAIDVSLDLTETPKDGTTPRLVTRLDGVETTLPLVGGSGSQWRAQVQLPADAGADGPQTLELALSAVDDLDNPGTRIEGPSRVQIYQGELPPLDVPAGLTATALPGGEVDLSWQPVDDAADYQLYRAGPVGQPGGDLSQPLVRSAGAETWIDQPAADGRYRYAVASVRDANGQERLSAPSAEVEVKADSLPPPAPTDLALALQATGVDLTWQAPVDPDPLTYRVYALPGEGLGGLSGDTAAVLDGIEDTRARDPAPPAPLAQRITYLVTALDPAGNESDTSAWDSVNVDLLPVATMLAERIDDGFPRVAWTHANDIAGVDLYLGDRDTGLKLNQDPLPGPDYQDLGFNGGTRSYTLVALDGLGDESLPRSLTLPDLIAEPQADAGGSASDGPGLRRGLMSRLTYAVTNRGGEDARAVVLGLDVGGHTHVSAPQDIPAGETRALSAVVGGYADLPALADIAVTLTQTPNPGEQTRLVSNERIQVTDGVLMLEIAARGMTRGGSGEVRFSVENIVPGQGGGAGQDGVPIQLVTAGAGGAPSDEIRVRLTDLDDNPLAEAALQQPFGSGIETLADGRSVVTIAPGARFESDWIELPIPEAAPDLAQLLLEIDQLHYRLGEPDAVSIAGQGTRTELTLEDTPYIGELIAITPAQSLGDAPIHIEGRAVDRETGEPVLLVGLDLVIANDGYERVLEMTTGTDGGFAYDYQPLSAESGTFRVSVVHPDLLTRPEQGSFSVGRVFVEPARQSLRLGRDAERALSLAVTTAPDFPVTNAHLRYLPQDQLFGALEPGIAVGPGPGIDLGAGAAGSLALTLTPDQTALGDGTLMLRVVADEGGDAPLAMVRLDYTVVDAGAALLAEPGFLELGAAPGGRASGGLVLRNQGLSPAQGVTVSLVDAGSGEPVDWAFLTTNGEIGSLPVGGEYPVDLTIAPTDAVAEATHELAIQVASSGAAGFQIPVYAHVTRAGAGNVLFHVADIFTATPDESGEPIPGVAGARIEVQHELFGDVKYDGTTDAAGELLLNGLTAGHYLFRVHAPDHAEALGRLSIQPGATVSRDVFLDYDLITLEWEVTEITLEDRYEIVLHLTYETDVPAPVVVIEPAGITLPDMAPGEVIRGELTITNYGLVRADGVRFTPAPDDAFFDYSFLADVPSSLDAKQRVTVPYRIVSLQPLDAGADAAATGGAGGSCGYASSARIEYEFQCANGDQSSGSGSFIVSSNVSRDCGGPSHSVPPGGGGAGRGRGASPGPGGMIPCPPQCEGDCCDRYGPGGGPGGGGGGPGGAGGGEL